jgi:predicted DNA-binding protein
MEEHIMNEPIRITKKRAKKGDDGYKIVSVRMRDELIVRLEELSAKTNRLRNEQINLLLEAAVENVKIEK